MKIKKASLAAEAAMLLRTITADMRSMRFVSVSRLRQRCTHLSTEQFAKVVRIAMNDPRYILRENLSTDGEAICRWSLYPLHVPRSQRPALAWDC